PADELVAWVRTRLAVDTPRTS
ncbi:MAG: hypothetical protein QOJ60_1270, partial [Actinomycetota bacterium]|nr:hypothetical protein [Actinomycetota bacterium]